MRAHHPWLPAALAAACLFTLEACVSTPPGPAVRPMPAADWSDAQPPGAPDPRWWTRFGDPRLDALVAQADAAAPTLQQARARLLEARAARAAVRGATLPNIGAEASYSRDRLSRNGELPVGLIPGFKRDLSLYQVGFDATWEVDLWGGQAAARRGAAAREQVAEAQTHGVALQLRAEVVQAWLRLRAARDTQAALDEAAAAARDEAARLHRRAVAGESTRLEAERAEAAARDAAGAVSTPRAEARAAAAALAALLGRPPEALSAELLAPGRLPDAPDGLGAGLRSDVLRRRPDVIAAERALAAAKADIGVAIAALFPHLYLSGTLAQQSRDIATLTQGGSQTFQAGPALSWPILQQGTLRAQVHAADARARQAAAAYEEAVFGALADSETALDRLARAREAQAEAAAGVAALARGLDLAQARVAAGEDDAGAHNAARLAWSQAQARLIAARLATDIDLVAACKSLGT